MVLQQGVRGGKSAEICGGKESSESSCSRYRRGRREPSVYLLKEGRQPLEMLEGCCGPLPQEGGGPAPLPLKTAASTNFKMRNKKQGNISLQGTGKHAVRLEGFWILGPFVTFRDESASELMKVLKMKSLIGWLSVRTGRTGVNLQSDLCITGQCEAVLQEG